MSVTYLAKEIVETMRTPIPHYGVTVMGYSKLSGAPTSIKIRLAGEKIWRRVMVWCFSNASTSFVRINGVPHVIPDHDLHVRP